jgi:hypothetical protein
MASVHGATIHLRPTFKPKTGMRSVRYLTLHGKFTSGMQAGRAPGHDCSPQLRRTSAPRGRLKVIQAGSTVQLVGGLGDLAALVAGALKLIGGRQA